MTLAVRASLPLQRLPAGPAHTSVKDATRSALTDTCLRLAIVSASTAGTGSVVNV